MPAFMRAFLFKSSTKVELSYKVKKGTAQDGSVPGAVPFFALVFHLKKRAGKISSLPARGVFIPLDPSR